MSPYLKTLLALSLGLGACRNTAPAALELANMAQSVRALQSQQGRLAARLHDMELALATARALAHPAAQAAAAALASAETDAETAATLPVVRLAPEAPAAAPEATAAPPVQLYLAPDTSPVPQASPEAPPPTASQASLLQRGLDLYQNGELTRAYAAFNALVQQQPRPADAATARYWMGACQLESGAYAAAVHEFSWLADHHPDSPQAADAMLRLGLAHERLGHTDSAQAALARLVARYPASAAAELARARLRGAGGAHGA